MTPEQTVFNLIQSFPKATLLLDCRSKEAFEGCHLRGSYNLPADGCELSEVTIERISYVVPDRVFR
jgi:rhodanese-related sulfurtransferase